jgi:hypothetical protein
MSTSVGKAYTAAKRLTSEALVFELAQDPACERLAGLGCQLLAVLVRAHWAEDDARQPDRLKQVGQQRTLDAESTMAGNLVRARERVRNW